MKKAVNNFWDAYIKRGSRVILYTTQLPNGKVVFNREYVRLDFLIPGNRSTVRQIWADRTTTLPSNLEIGQIWQATFMGCSYQDRKCSKVADGKFYFKDFELVADVHSIDVPGDDQFFKPQRDGFAKLKVDSFVKLRVVLFSNQKVFEILAAYNGSTYTTILFKPIFLPNDLEVGEEWIVQIKNIETAGNEHNSSKRYSCKVLPVQRVKITTFTPDLESETCIILTKCGDRVLENYPVNVEIKQELFKSQDGKYVINKIEVHIDPNLNNGVSLVDKDLQYTPIDKWLVEKTQQVKKVNWNAAISKLPVLQN